MLTMFLAILATLTYGSYKFVEQKYRKQFRSGGGSGGRVVYEKNTMKQHLFVAGTSEVGLCKINDAEHSIENQDGRLSRPFINPRCIFFVLGKDSTI